MNNTLKLLWVLVFSCISAGMSQTLPNFKPSATPKVINWQQFPEFSLPPAFKVVYGGPRLGQANQTILSRGFTHLGTYTETDRNLPYKNRAFLYGNLVVSNPPQPWFTQRTPWGNDMDVYNNLWNKAYEEYTWLFENPTYTGRISTDIFVYDIERQVKSVDSIALLKNLPSTPAAYKSLSNEAFARQYHLDLQKLYATPLTIFKSRGMDVNVISSYSDAPILNTFTRIQNLTWEQWKTDLQRAVNPLLIDYQTNKMGGPMYEAQNWMSPSAYYYFDYPSPFAQDYLSYLLFQIEANKAWSQKPILLFVWMKYSQNESLRNAFIRPWMAEATAIFPLMGGAQGVWLWDDPTTANDNLTYAAYEHYIHGLYRLAQHKDMFEGNWRWVEGTPARLLNQQRKPVWRAVQKGNELLVAAHNPYASSETQEAEVAVQVGNWSTIMKLTGFEVALKRFSMTALGINEELKQVNAFPNPASERLQIDFYSSKKQEVFLEFYNVQGKLCGSLRKNAHEGQQTVLADVSSFAKGQYILKVKLDNQQISKIISVQ